MRTRRTVPRRITNSKGVQTTVHVNPDSGVRSPEVADKLKSSGVSSASATDFAYPGVEEPKEQVLSLFRMDSGADDDESVAVNHVMAMCDVIHAHGGDVPKRFQYRPGAHAENARDVKDKSTLGTFREEWPDSEYHEMLLNDSTVNTDVMISAAESIHDHFLAEDREDQKYDFDGNLREDAYRRSLQSKGDDEVEESLEKLEAYGEKIPGLEKAGIISPSRVQQHRDNHKKQIDLTKLELVRRIES